MTRPDNLQFNSYYESNLNTPQLVSLLALFAQCRILLERIGDDGFVLRRSM